MIASNQDLSIDPLSTFEMIEQFIRTKVEQYHRDGAIVGLSGGIDSAVTAALATKALGITGVLGLIMPERDSNPASRYDARRLADSLDIKIHTVKLTPLLRQLGAYKLVPKALVVSYAHKARYAWKRFASLSERLQGRPFASSLIGINDVELTNSMAYARAKNRLRMAALYFEADKNNLLVLGTANKTEWMTGLFVRYGDGAADVMPLLSLYKTQVIRLGEYLNLPRPILTKEPSPDLVPGISDEDLLGLPYEDMDMVLHHLEIGMDLQDIAHHLGLMQEEVEMVAQLVRDSEYMRRMPEACSVGP